MIFKITEYSICSSLPTTTRELFGSLFYFPIITFHFPFCHPLLELWYQLVGKELFPLVAVAIENIEVYRTLDTSHTACS